MTGNDSYSHQLFENIPFGFPIVFNLQVSMVPMNSETGFEKIEEKTVDGKVKFGSWTWVKILESTKNVTSLLVTHSSMNKTEKTFWQKKL